jgi:Na+-translocating ferredoxin:NAD+ oxidoreductase RnfA subunit
MIYRLSVKQYAILAGLFALIYGWVLIDQFFLPLVFQRFIALIIVAFSSITAYFFIVKPSEPYPFSAHLGLLLCLITAIISVVEHVIIHFNFSYKLLLILVIAFGSPFLSGFIYKSMKPKG